MTNRIFPNWEQIWKLSNPLTEGEISLLKYLDNNLPTDPYWREDNKLRDYKGWLIFAQPFLNGSQPDVVVFNPQVGMIIYEVKDWNIQHYKFKNNGYGTKQLYVVDSRGEHPIKSPISQVSHYKEKIVGQLVPNIGEAFDKDKQKYGLIKIGLYFHKIGTLKAQDFFGSRIKSLKDSPLFGYDFLKPEKLYEIVPEARYSKSKYWNPNWNEDIIFWLYPPYHTIEQGEALTLRGEQNKVAEPNPGHHRARGIAGSGKTQALAYRAAKLASQNLDVLIISFNITLWHYIRDMIARSPFPFSWGRITFNHFHGFCKEKLNKFGKKWPKSPDRDSFSTNEEHEKALEEFFKNTVPETVRETVINGQYQKYDAILIDEGQDYHLEWYSMLKDLFLKDRDEVLIVSDKKQNIYERNLDWFDKRGSKEGLEKFNSKIQNLTTNFRMPRRVAEVSNRFSEIFGLNQEIKGKPVDANPSLIHANHIIWLNIDEVDWEYYVWNAFLRLKKEEYNPADMVILLPSNRYGKKAIEMFNGKNIEVNHVFENNEEVKYHPHKRSFWKGDTRLKLSTIHSFKGWELPNIVLLIPEESPTSTEKLDGIVYTAITRTKQNLIVFNANERYADFGEKLPKNWHEQ